MVVRAQNIHIDLNCEKDHLLFAFDTEKMEQLLYNTISNGIKYSKKEFRALVTLDSSPDLMTTSVVDEGIGIKNEELPNIFLSKHI